MKIICEFESWDEMEAFRTSGKKTRGKSQMTEVEEAVETQAAKADPTVTQPQAFAPPAAPAHGFPGGNGGAPTAAAATNPLVTAILARIDGAVSSGQSSDAVVTWFRQQIGPDAANATLDQIKQVFVPRMTEQQLKQIAPQLGIQG